MYVLFLRRLPFCLEWIQNKINIKWKHACDFYDWVWQTISCFLRKCKLQAPLAYSFTQQNLLSNI